MTNSPPLLLVSCLLFASCSTFGGDEATRTSLTSHYASVLAAHDADGDEKLSRAETEAMIEIVFPKDRPAAVNSAELRERVIGDYAAQDTDQDGYLTLVELLKDPLATFDCMDVNSDDRLSSREIDSGMSRCASKTYDSVHTGAGAGERNPLFVSPSQFAGREVEVCGWVDGPNLLESADRRHWSRRGGISITDRGPLDRRYEGFACVSGTVEYLGCETGLCTGAAFDYAIRIRRVTSQGDQAVR
ncbi:MAG TPA: hypothetical protein VF582_04950 [Allosphingosinicella sp.]|jgi:hypothetical protein